MIKWQVFQVELNLSRNLLVEAKSYLRALSYYTANISDAIYIYASAQQKLLVHSSNKIQHCTGLKN